MVENKNEALQIWNEKGIKEAVLVHVDPDLYIKDNSPGNINKQGSRKTGYLSSAAGFGAFNEIYWMLPYSFFNDIPLAGKQVKDFLKSREVFDDDEINAMYMEYGCFKGMLSGIKISICSPRTLPFIKEPVILSVNVSFFPLFADSLSKSKLSAMKRFFDEIAFKHLQVIHVDISYNTKGGFTKALHRFIGDELFEGISDPEIFRSDSPPDLWRYRDVAENMLAGGEDRMVVEYLSEPLRQFPDDLPLRIIKAEATLKAGEENAAFREMSDICHTDIHYCYGFIDMGKMLAGKKQYQSAEGFFLEAVRALPDDRYVARQYSRFLEKSGHDSGAGPAGKKL